jgi:hypothetical protein
MKILIFGDEAGMFSNLNKWFREAGHESRQWAKFVNLDENTKDVFIGNKNQCFKCPMSDPDIILVAKNYLTWEDLKAMGINPAPRVYYNLGNSQMASLFNDKRFKIFNDHYMSYNPSHALVVDDDKQDRFANLKLAPLPIDYTQYLPNDYSKSELKIHQCQSDLAMAGPYDKQPDVIAEACKQNQVDYDLHFELDHETYKNIKTDYPVYFDNFGGVPGKATWEALASSQCVITKFNAYNKTKYEEMFGAELPILSAITKEELSTLIGDMKSGKIDWKNQCVLSRQFMEKHCSPSAIANIYLDHFQSILGAKK